MIKKLSMMVLGVAVAMFCVTTMAVSEVEAGWITCSGSHKHKKESGTGFCRGEVGNQTANGGFTTSNEKVPKYKVTLGGGRVGLWANRYTVRVAGGCMASNYQNGVRVGYMGTSITINY